MRVSNVPLRPWPSTGWCSWCAGLPPTYESATFPRASPSRVTWVRSAVPPWTWASRRSRQRSQIAVDGERADGIARRVACRPHGSYVGPTLPLPPSVPPKLTITGEDAMEP